MSKALYILAGFDSAADEKLNALQNKLYGLGFTGTHTKNIPMHITLGSFPTDMEEKLKDKLTKISESTSPVETVFNHIGIFGGGNVLFACPDVNKELLELKENFGSAFGWTAHSTLLIDEPETVLKAIPYIMEDFSAFEAKVTSLHLYEFFPTRYICSVKLKGDKNA